MTSSLLCSRALGPEQLANDLTSDKKNFGFTDR